MNQPFRIEQRESFRILGYMIETTNKGKQATKEIRKHWENFQKNHLEEIVLPLNNQEPLGVFGISVYNVNEKDARQFKYYIGVSSNQPETNELSEYTVPASTWAVFPCTIETIGKTEVQAIMKWLPRSNYKPLNAGYITGRMKANAPDIEYYGKDNVVEVWVAVKEK